MSLLLLIILLVLVLCVAHAAVLLSELKLTEGSEGSDSGWQAIVASREVLQDGWRRRRRQDE